jgi:hypothetical protein
MAARSFAYRVDNTTENAAPTDEIIDPEPVTDAVRRAQDFFEANARWPTAVDEPRTLYTAPVGLLGEWFVVHMLRLLKFPVVSALEKNIYDGGYCRPCDINPDADLLTNVNMLPYQVKAGSDACRTWAIWRHKTFWKYDGALIFFVRFTNDACVGELARLMCGEFSHNDGWMHENRLASFNEIQLEEMITNIAGFGVLRVYAVPCRKGSRFRSFYTLPSQGNDAIAIRTARFVADFGHHELDLLNLRTVKIKLSAYVADPLNLHMNIVALEQWSSEPTFIEHLGTKRLQVSDIV